MNPPSVLRTMHGDLALPLFLPVATQAAVPHIGPDDLRAVGCTALLVNALYVALRPGVDLVVQAGGLHRFMGWNGPIATASGSFQLRVGTRATTAPVAERLDDTGATIISHVDGSRHRWTPEVSIETQHKLGSDVMLALSQQTDPGMEQVRLRQAVDRTLRWNERSLAAYLRLQARDDAQQPVGQVPNRPLLFAVVQGGADPEQRRRCAVALAGQPFDGFAIGGKLGDGAQASEALQAALEALPPDKPHYLLATRSPDEAGHAIALGADLASGTFPTKLAQQGKLLADNGHLNISDAPYERDGRPPVADCPCPLCTHFSRAYLHHLFKAHEMLAPRLAGIHNLHTVQRAIAR